MIYISHNGKGGILLNND